MKFRYKKLLAKLTFWDYALIPLSCLAVGTLVTINFLSPNYEAKSAYAEEPKQIELSQDANKFTECKFDTIPVARLSVIGRANDDSTKVARTDGVVLRNYEVRSKTCNSDGYSLGIQGDNTLTAKDSAGAVIAAINAVAEDSSQITDDTWGYFYDAESGNKGTAADKYNNFITGDTRTLADITYMQDVNAAICANTPWYTEHDKNIYTLKDSRDQKEYTVQKFAGTDEDGLCMMVSNLALDLYKDGAPVVLTSADSNVSHDWPSGSDTSVTQSRIWSTSTCNTTTSNLTNCNIFNYWDGTGNSTYSRHWKEGYGYYYTWCAATAGTCTTDRKNSTNSIDANVKAAESICPKGWRLPDSGTTAANNDFAKIFGYTGSLNANIVSPDQAGHSATMVSPDSNGKMTVSRDNSTETSDWYAAGNVGSSVLGNYGSRGYYWSRTAYTKASAYHLYAYSGTLNPASLSSHNNGISVRCVADMSNTESDLPDGYKELEQGNGDAIGETKNLTFAVKFGSEAAEGEYKSTVNLLLVATPKTAIDYTITYHCGPSVSCDDLPDAQESEHVYATAWPTQITEDEPTYDEYVFLGWSETSYPVGTGTADYEPSDPITVCTTSDAADDCDFISTDVTLYAVWEPEGSGFGSGEHRTKKMQGMTGEVCNSVDISTVGELLDVRDNNVYTVRRHEDGRCWMVQNLRFISTDYLDSETSDVLQAPSLPNSQKFIINKSCDGFSTSNYNASKACYRNELYGTYYNWFTATAGTGTSSVGTGDVSSSVCPKGWKLPTQAEFQAFFNASRAKVTSLDNAPYYFQPTGSLINDSFEGDSKDGYYWSRTSQSQKAAYYLGLYPSSGNQADKASGFAIRCIAK